MLSRQLLHARSPFSSMGAFSRRSQLATFCTPTVLEVRPGPVVPRLILPLNNAKYSFPLRPGNLLRQLLQDIRAEAPAIGEIVATDSKGVRLAQTTPISTLMKNGFEMRVDNKKYSVEPASTEAPASVLAVVDVQDLCAKAYFVKIRKRIAEDKRDHITYAEYESWCSEYGLSADQAKSLAQALHIVGDVLYFATNPKLKDFLFLHPTYVTGSVANALNINFVKVGHGQSLKRLQEILPEYLALNNSKLAFDKSAEKSADLWMKGSGVYLVIQFLILARMVWIDFNWDIMEPVTYFVTLGGTILGYLFFILFKVEYTYMALKERQIRKYLRKLYLKNEFKWTRWNELDQEVHHLVHELGGANVPKELEGLPNWKKCQDHPTNE